MKKIISESKRNVDLLYRGELTISWWLHYTDTNRAELYIRNYDTSKMDYEQQYDYENTKATMAIDNADLFTYIFEQILSDQNDGDIELNDTLIGWWEYEWRSKRGITYDK